MGLQREISAATARVAVCNAIFAAVLVFCGSASADEWLLRGQASEQLVFDSNIRLSNANRQSNTNRQSVFGSITSLGGDLVVSAPRADATISGQASVLRYPQDSTLNSEDLGLTLRSSYRFTRSAFSLGASLRRASTLVTEATNAGNFSQIANQISMGLSPSWQYQLSPRNTISIDGNWARQTYDSGSFADATTYSIGGSWIHQRSAIDSISVTGRASYIASEGSANTTRTQSYSILFGWNRSLSDRVTFMASAGPRLSFQSESVARGATSETTSLGADVDLALTYRLSERTVLGLSGGQSLEPSSAGGVEQRQRVNLTLGHQLSQRMQLNLAASFQHNGAGFQHDGASVGFSNNTLSKNRLYFTTSASVAYQISPTLSISGNYAIRGQKNDANQPFAISHTIGAVLSYSPRGWILGK